MVNVATSNPIEQRRSSPEMGPGYVLLSALPQIATHLMFARNRLS